MAKEDDLYAKVDILNHEAGELETEAVAQHADGAQWLIASNATFNKLSAEQTEAGWHFQLADTARRAAKKKRKEALKLERKARRIAPNRNG